MDVAATSRNPKLVYIAPVTVCLALHAMLGCGGMKESRRSGSGARAPIALGLSEPPSVEGSSIRSQDGTKLARRVTPKKSAEYAAAVPSTTKPPTRTKPTATADPGPPPLLPGTPEVAAQENLFRVAPLPAPPLLPEDASITAPPPEITRGAPTPEPPTNTTLPAAIEPPTVTAPTTSAAPAAAPEDGLKTIRRLVDESHARLAAIPNYQTRMTRQERVGATLLPVENVILSVRREPFAVRLEWPEGQNKGREVLFSQNETGGKMQINQPGSLVPRLSLDPASPLVLKNSRHPITEAGLENIISTLDTRLKALESGQGDGSTMTYAGQANVQELGRICHQITEKRANGETWLIALDAETMLPSILRAQAPDGTLVELYVFRDVQTNLPELAAASAFQPETRWANKSPGFLDRIIR